MSRPLRVAVASGKGGTGKTTLATNLAVALSRAGRRVAYLDCDVEEPNGHLFLRPEILRRQEVSVPVPEVDPKLCNACGACGKACRHSAILALPTKVLTFPKLCHGCGGCALACPTKAIREVPRSTGAVEEGAAGPLLFVHGTLAVGEAMAPPVIRAVLAAAPSDCETIVDAPPGTSCPVIESVKGADVVLLVTEPTPFGLNDLKLAVAMVRALGLPFGVAVSRAGSGDPEVHLWCATEGIPVLLELEDDREIARAYSRGELAVSARPELAPRLLALHEDLARLARRVAPPRPTQSASPAPLPEPRRGAPPSEAARREGPDDGQRGPYELVVISGKGGTGKTSVAASLFALAQHAAVCDCDVDAADLHLVLAPEVQQRWPFLGGKTARIDAARCTGGGVCAEHCRFGAVRPPADGASAPYDIAQVSCEGCGVCVDHCPSGAISLVPTVNGEWFVSQTRHGPMVHARLGVAQENSGKLVTLVRKEARALARSSGRGLLICDGSPGIGCPVMASITGAQRVLVVTEPTLSGLHDLERVAELCRQFEVPAGLCINKADLNLELAAKMEARAARWGLPVLGRIRYDPAVTRAQVSRLPVVECGDSPAAEDLRALWARLKRAMGEG